MSSSDVFLINGSALSDPVDRAVLINDSLAAPSPVKRTCSKLISHEGIDFPSLSLAFFLSLFLSYSPCFDLSGERNPSTTFTSIAISGPLYNPFMFISSKKKKKPEFPESTSGNDFRSVSRRRGVAFRATSCRAVGLPFPFRHFKP